MPDRETREDRQHSTAYIPYSFYECRIPEASLNVPMHWHDEFEINRVVRGRGEFICGDNKLTAEEGDMLVIPPDMLHAAYTPEGETLVYQAMVFSPLMLGANGNDRCTLEYIRPLVQGSLRPDNLISTGTENYTELREAARRIFAYGGFPDRGEEGGGMTVSGGSPGTELLLKGELMRFFGLLTCQGSGEDGPGSGISLSEAVRPALEYMVENYANNISVEELAGRVHLSKSYFMSCFKKAVGVGAIEYLAQLRVNAACERLTGTDQAVSEIAFACGYNNLSNFNRQFRRVKGCSPREYRKSRG